MKRILLVIFVFTLTFSLSAQEKKSELSSSTISGLKFRSIGPALASGRITDFAVNPNKFHEYYVAVASGGVWKTTNSGTTWKPIFDSQKSYSIGCVTLDPNNEHVVWVGSGENNSQRSVSYGDGVYKSIDGGKSWKNMGLKTSEHIGKIIVDPRNSNTVFVAAQGPLWNSGGDRGLYKTVDGGKNWKKVLEISENTGVSDLVMDPRNPDVMYVSSYQRRRHIWTLINGGPESAVYKTEDGGENWDKISSGLPGGDVGRIGLAISPVNPDYVYAIIEAAEKKGGFFRTTNRGASWSKRSDMVARSPQYYNEIVCDPFDVEKVYSLDTWTKVTVDGGKTFKSLSNKKRHVDDHALWLNPNVDGHILIGGDGGIYESYDFGNNWEYKSNFPITQFYRVAVDNAEPFYFVYGGTQDNNTIGGPSRTVWREGILNSDWFVTNGGDGFESQIDPEDPNTVYSQSQYGWLVRYNKLTGERIGIKPQEKAGEAAYRWNWDAPLVISPHSHTRLYFAANKVFRSDDKGNTWETISGDLTRQLDRNDLSIMGKIWNPEAVAKNASTSLYGNIVSLYESPVTEGLIYAGTDDGLIQVTTNGGSDWKKYDSFNGVPDYSYVSCIMPSEHNGNTVYASFDNHKKGDYKPYILKSDDAGNTWTNISADLPDNETIYTIAEDFKDPNLLFIGTEFGVYFTNDGGKKWIRLKSGLPTIAVKDIDIQERECDLVLGTFGRGFYVLDDYSPLRNLSKTTLDKPADIFEIKDALIFIPRSAGTGSQGSTLFASKNPEFGATFTYYVKDKVKSLKQKRKKQEKEDVKAGRAIKYPTMDELKAEDDQRKSYLLFTIYNEAGQVIRKIKKSASTGVNRLVWNLRHSGLRPVTKTSGEMDNGSTGYRAVPGNYMVSLSQMVDGELTQLVEPKPFKVIPLNDNTFTEGDRIAYAEFNKKVNEAMRVLSGASEFADGLKEKIGLIQKAIHLTNEAPPQLLKDAQAIEDEIKELLITLNGDASISKRNANQTPSISDRLSNAVWGGWAWSGAPTTTQKDNYKIVVEAYKEIKAKLSELSNLKIPKLEKELEAAGAPWTPGRLPDLKSSL